MKAAFGGLKRPSVSPFSRFTGSAHYTHGPELCQ